MEVNHLMIERWEIYEEILRLEHALDFDDLLIKTLLLIKIVMDLN
jgi:superfamily I DNA/RNA helicase